MDTNEPFKTNSNFLTVIFKMAVKTTLLQHFQNNTLMTFFLSAQQLPKTVMVKLILHETKFKRLQTVELAMLEAIKT